MLKKEVLDFISPGFVLLFKELEVQYASSNLLYKLSIIQYVDLPFSSFKSMLHIAYNR